MPEIAARSAKTEESRPFVPRRLIVMSNNPNKRDGLLQAGIEVEGMIPHKMKPNPHNADYLMTKKLKSGHYL